MILLARVIIRVLLLLITRYMFNPRFPLLTARCPILKPFLGVTDILLVDHTRPPLLAIQAHVTSELLLVLQGHLSAHILLARSLCCVLLSWVQRMLPVITGPIFRVVLIWKMTVIACLRNWLPLFEVDVHEIARGLVVVLLDIEHVVVLQDAFVDVAAPALSFVDLAVQERVGRRCSAGAFVVELDWVRVNICFLLVVAENV